MLYGGFPKVVLTEDISLKEAELKSYLDSILLRDIVARYKLDNFRILEQLSIFLLSSISNIKEYEQINLVQVSQMLTDDKTKKRELRALVKASDELKHSENINLLLLTMDESYTETIDDKTIKVINILEWLLLDD